MAFATILAVVAGLTMSASASFAHDFYSNVIHHGKTNRPGMEVKVARITAFCVGAVSISIAIYLGPSVNAAFLVGLAFAVAASANLPVIMFSTLTERGATATLETVWCMPEKTPFDIDERMSIIGTEGIIHVQDTFPNLGIVDANGAVLCTTQDGAQGSTSAGTRDWFQELRSGKTDFVQSTAYYGPVSQQWIIASARRRNNPDGSFAGAYVLGVPVNSLVRQLERSEIGRAHV